MKQYLVFGIFLYISRRNKTTAKEIADTFEISPRTVYRYLDALSMAKVPVQTECGKNGGISIDSNFSLENFVLSQSEKNTLRHALKSNIGYDVKNILNKICV